MLARFQMFGRSVAPIRTGSNATSQTEFPHLESIGGVPLLPRSNFAIKVGLLFMNNNPAKRRLDDAYLPCGKSKYGGQGAETMQQRVAAFWRYTDKRKKNQCWNWKRHKNTKIAPYGVISWGKFQELAHRVSWFIHHGKDPWPFLVLHRCDNPSCVNPHHLFLGTFKTNAQDALGKGRLYIAKGVQCHSAKLNEQDVKVIRSLYQPRKYPLSRLAKEFKVSRQAIQEAVLKTTWKHI